MDTAERSAAADRRRGARRGDDPVTSLVQDHIWLVEAIVSELAAGWPKHVDRGELAAVGRLGLVEAARRYDPHRGVTFPNFARTRVRGSVLDALRDLDWAPRRVRTAARDVATVRGELMAQLRRPPTPEELAEATGYTLEQLKRLDADAQRATVLALDAPAPGPEGGDAATLAELVLAPATGAEQRLEDLEMRALVSDALALLDERSRRVIAGYFLEGRTSAELAAELGVTESRVSQIRSSTLSRLNAVLEAQWKPPPPSETPSLRERRATDYATAVARYRGWRARLASGAALAS
jgi:RNA polymerase sigma factor for flagellar operon FliA